MARIRSPYDCRGRVAGIGGAAPTVTAHMTKNTDEGLVGWIRG